MTYTKKGTIRGRISKQEPNPVDVHIGNRIRLRRTILGYSQQVMAHKLGLTFQQVQKYEKGCNRVGASRLWDIAQVLQVPTDFFYQDMDKKTADNSPMMLSMAEKDLFYTNYKEENDPFKRQETLELVRNYYKINNRELAKHIFNLIEGMSRSNSTLPDDVGSCNG